MGFLIHNLRLKLVAAGLACAMWLAVVYASNPPAVQTVVVTQVAAQGLARGLELVGRPGGPRGVALRIAGLRSNVQDAASVMADLRLSVDLSSIRAAGTYSVPLRVRKADPSVAVFSQPARVTVRVDRRVTEVVTVRALPRGIAPSGFTATVTALEPSTIQVSGPRSVVRAVRAVVRPDLSGLRTSLSQPAPVTLVGVPSSLAHGLRVTPVEVTAVIAVTSQLSTRTLPVVVTFAGDGQPPTGTRLTDIRSVPSTVQASGPAAELNQLNQASTEPVDLAAASLGLTVAVPLVQPAGVTLSPATVTVVISVGLVPQPTATPVPSPSPTPSPLRRPHRSPRPTPRPTPRATPRPARRPTPRAGPTATPAPTPSPTPTPRPTRTPTPTPTPSPTVTPTPPVP